MEAASVFATVSRKPCLASLGQGLPNLDCQKTESKEGTRGRTLHTPSIGFSGCWPAWPGAENHSGLALPASPAMHPPAPPTPTETVADLHQLRGLGPRAGQRVGWLAGWVGGTTGKKPTFEHLS